MSVSSDKIRGQKYIFSRYGFWKNHNTLLKARYCGKEGKADSVKEKKFKYAKKLVEWVAENEDIKIFNLSHGEKVFGVQDICIKRFLILHYF